MSNPTSCLGIRASCLPWLDLSGVTCTHLLKELVIALGLDALLVEEGAIGGAQVHEIRADRCRHHPVGALLLRRPAAPPRRFTPRQELTMDAGTEANPARDAVGPTKYLERIPWRVTRAAILLFSADPNASIP